MRSIGTFWIAGAIGVIIIIDQRVRVPLHFVPDLEISRIVRRYHIASGHAFNQLQPGVHFIIQDTRLVSDASPFFRWGKWVSTAIVL